MGSLGWDISGSYHVLQLLSSLTPRYTAIPEAERSWLLNILYQEIIMRTILSSKERFTITQRSRRAFAETTKTGKDVIIVIFLKPARRAQASWMNPPGTEASYPPQSLWPGELEP